MVPALKARRQGLNGTIEDVVTSSTGDSTLSEASTEDPLEDVVDMLYYKRLGDDSIMAACYTEEGIADWATITMWSMWGKQKYTMPRARRLRWMSLFGDVP